MSTVRLNRSWFVCAAGVLSALGAGAPALATPNADYYLLLSDGDMYRGWIGGDTTFVANTPMGGTGSLTSAAEFAPDGRLLASGGSGGLSAGAFVAELDPETGTATILVTSAEVRLLVPDMFIMIGLAVAEDGSFYTLANRLVGPGGEHLPEMLLHFDPDGGFLGSAVLNSDEIDATNWSSHAMTVRDDGMVISGAGDRVMTIDPETGVMDLLGTLPHTLYGPRDMTSFGAYSYLTLGDDGEDVYALDLYTGDIEFVVTLNNLPSTAFGFSFTNRECPADADRDNRLSADDVTLFADRFLADNDEADYDFDADRDLDDVISFVNSFTDGCP